MLGAGGTDRDWRSTPPVLLERGFLDGAQCARIRTAMTRGRHEAAEVLADAFRSDRRARRARSIEVEDAVLSDVEARLDACAGRVSRFFGVQLRGREGAGFLRYGRGDFYGIHRDHATDTVWPGASLRRISLVVFLNTEGAGAAGGTFRGGLLRIHDAGMDVRPAAGLLVAFPSTLQHEVTPVGRGVRDVVVDWFY